MTRKMRRKSVADDVLFMTARTTKGLNVAMMSMAHWLVTAAYIRRVAVFS